MEWKEKEWSLGDWSETKIPSRLISVSMVFERKPTNGVTPDETIVLVSSQNALAWTAKSTPSGITEIPPATRMGSGTGRENCNKQIYLASNLRCSAWFNMILWFSLSPIL